MKIKCTSCLCPTISEGRYLWEGNAAAGTCGYNRGLPWCSCASGFLTSGSRSTAGSAVAVGLLLKYSCFLHLYKKVLTKFSCVFVCLFVFVGSIVSVGDPKKKYTCFEKIGQGLVYAPSLSCTFPYVKKEALKPG